MPVEFEICANIARIRLYPGGGVGGTSVGGISVGGTSVAGGAVGAVVGTDVAGGAEVAGGGAVVMGADVGGGAGVLVDGGGALVGGSAACGTQTCWPMLRLSLGKQLTSSKVSTGISARSASLDKESPLRMV